MTETHEIRALMAPVAGGAIVLPGSVVAEVINFTEPVPFSEAPGWLMGEIEWNGWQIPVVNFAYLAETSQENTVPPRSRILVVKTLTDAASVLYVGLVISGLPKLLTLTTGNLAESGPSNAPGVFSHVNVDGDIASIPDLDGLALSIEQAVYRA